MSSNIQLTVPPNVAIKLIWHLGRSLVACVWMWMTGSRDLTISFTVTNAVVTHSREA